MSWMQIAQANGITETVNGSWIQAICESLGIMETVNGSWEQALAQYGPFGSNSGGAQLDNTASVSGITYGEIYQSKGIDVVDIQITFDLGVPFNQENVYKALTFSVEDRGAMPLFIVDFDEINPIFTIGVLSGPIAISEPIMVVVGEQYDVIMTMFNTYQDLTTAPTTSLPVVFEFTATP